MELLSFIHLKDLALLLWENQLFFIEPVNVIWNYSLILSYSGSFQNSYSKALKVPYIKKNKLEILGIM